jgi:WD40 repeat protein
MALIKQGKNPGFPVIPVILPGFEGRPSGFLELLTWIDFRCGTRLVTQPERLQSLLAACRNSGPGSVVSRSTTCPYMGLEPFREKDAVFYYGRDGLIAEIVSQVQSNGFVTVVGRSGSGKSSLIFAGLFPALRRQRSTTVWDIVWLRPGAWPLHALAEALSSPPTNAGPAARDAFIEDEVKALRDGDVERLTRIIDRRLDTAVEKPDRLLIYVDQWEELYTMAPAAGDQAASARHATDLEKFISLLVGISGRLRSRCKVVITIRADFYEQLIRHSLTNTLLPQQQVNIGPLQQDDLRSAILKPASIAGLSFKPSELVQEILDDVGADEGMLPLLQYALKETWARREGNDLTAEGYTAAGGVRGAIQSTADRTYASLGPEEKRLTRRLFLGLVRPGEGRDDTRARLAIPDDPQMREIIKKFSDRRTRLLITGAEEVGVAIDAEAGHAIHKQRATVEVAHEALIRNWSTLREWLDLNRDRLRARSAILQSKTDWEAAGQDDRALLPVGFQLDRARALFNDPGDVPLEDIREYIDRSIEHEDRRIAEDLADELEKQRRIAEAERRARDASEIATQEARSSTEVELKARRAADKAANALRRWLIISIVAGVAAATAMVFAVEQKGTAIHNLQAAFLTNAEESLVEQRPTAANLLALSGITKELPFGLTNLGGLADASVSSDQTVRLKSIAALTQSAATEPQRVWGGTMIATAAAISSDRSLVAIGDASGVVHVEATAGSKGYQLKGHGNSRILSLSFAGPSRLVSSTVTEIIVWDLKSRQSRVVCNAGTIAEAAVDSDGNGLTWATKDGRVFFRSLSSDASQPISVEDSHSATAVSISSNGRWIASAGDGGDVVVRGTPNLADATLIKTAHNDIISIALDPEGKRVAIASLSGPVEVWRVTKEAQRPIIISILEDKRWKVRFSANGKWLGVASWRGTVSLWDPTNLAYAGTIDGNDHRVNDLAFSNGSDLVTASESGVARLWKLADIQPVFREVESREAGENILGAYNAEGSLFASAGKDGIARVYSVLPNGQLSFSCQTGAPTDRLIGMSQLSDKKMLATIQLAERNPGTYDVIRFWKSSDCQPASEYRDPDRTQAEGLSYDPQHSVLAWGDAQGRIALMSLAHAGDRIWMPAKPEEAVHTKSIADLAFSPDGKWLASAGNDGILAIWNAVEQRLDHKKQGPTARLNTVQFSPDGQLVAAGGDDKSIFVWETGTSTPAKLLAFPGGTNRLAFSPDGTMLGAGSDNRRVAVWSTQTSSRIFQLNKLVGVRSVFGFNPRTNDLAFDGENGLVRVIPGASLRALLGQIEANTGMESTEISFDARHEMTLVNPDSDTIKATRSSCF